LEKGSVKRSKKKEGGKAHAQKRGGERHQEKGGIVSKRREMFSLWERDNPAASSSAHTSN